MPAITLVNQVPANTAPSAEFRLSQGSHPIARIDVHAGAQASIPTFEGAPTYSVQAVTQMGDFTLTSNTLTITGTSVTVLAQVLSEEGSFDFQLKQLPGTQLGAILCENTWRAPVQFTLKAPVAPVQIVTVVDEHNTDSVNTAQQWEAYAIIDGITTLPVIITDPSATVVLTAGGADESYSLKVTEGTQAPATPCEADAKGSDHAGATVIPVTPAA